MALYRLFYSVKVGNNGQWQDGMLIDRHDELETGVSFIKALTPDCSKKFRFLQVDRRMKPYLDKLLKPVGFLKIFDELGMPIPDPEKYRVRGGVLPLVDLAAHCGKTVEEIRKQDMAFAPINGLLLSEDKFKSSQLFTPDGSIIDRAAITGGACSIGAGGAAPNYLTWALFGADVGALASAIIATMMAATTETGSCSVNVALNGYSITITASVNPKGNFNSGFLISQNFAGALFAFICSSTSPGATLNFSNINHKVTGGSTTTLSLFIDIRNNTTNITNNINDCLSDANSSRIYTFYFNGANCIFNLFNCKVANGYGAASVYHNTGLIPVSCHANSKINNYTAYNFTGAGSSQGIGFWNYVNNALSIRNLACFGNTKGYAYLSSRTNGVGNATAFRAAASDATGPDALFNSLVAADEFESLDIASADYLKLKSTGRLASYGELVNIAANTYGSRGNARPH